MNKIVAVAAAASPPLWVHVIEGWGLSRARSAARTRAGAVAVDMAAAQSAALVSPAAVRLHLDRHTASAVAAPVAAAAEAVASVLAPHCVVHA